MSPPTEPTPRAGRSSRSARRILLFALVAAIVLVALWLAWMAVCSLSRDLVNGFFFVTLLGLTGAITVAFLATLLPLIERRVRVVFADIESETLCIDPNTIEDKVTDRTRAIYVMHYGGLPCDMDPIMEIAERHGLYVVDRL